MTVKKCEFKDGVCVHCGDDHIDTDCIGWIDTPPNPEIARLETELLAATIRIDNDAKRIAEMTEQLDIQAGSIDAVQAANVRLAEARDALAADAARYRFISAGFTPLGLDMSGNHPWVCRVSPSRLKGPTLDEAIDAAMKGEAK